MPLLLAGPLAKILGILVLVIALFGAGEWHGRHAVHQAWDAEIAQQAIASAKTVIEQAEHTAKAEVKYIKIQGATKLVTKIVEKEIIKYVQDPTQAHCVLPPQFERGFDAISGVLDRYADGVPAPSHATGTDAEHAPAPLTEVAVLYAHHDTVTQLGELWDAYNALAFWVRESYILQRAASGRTEGTE